MTERADLEARLRGVEGVTVAPWKDGHYLICVNFHGKEVGHFHGEDVIDLRLSPKVIREEGLTRAVSQEIHPDRTLTSRWIGLRLSSAADVDEIVRLVQRACALR